VKESDPEEHAEDLQSLFAEVNQLPPDDPLRNPANQGPVQTDVSPAQAAEAAPPSVSGSETDASSQNEAGLSGRTAAPTSDGLKAHGSVRVAVQRVAVPSFAGKSLREVVQQAGGMGLGVQVIGSGVAREQAPAAGTMVPAGTDIVVRFAQ